MLRGVLRMFRHAVNESHPDDPYRRLGDTKEFDRIRTALQQCFDAPEEQPMKFVYNETVCPAEVWKIFWNLIYKSLNLCKCLNSNFVCFESTQLSTAILKFKNKSAPADSRNVSCYVPCELRFNTTKYDIPVEAAWKVVMFTHYFCARHFKDIGYDHSRYARKMEEFFNREIIHRW